MVCKLSFFVGFLLPKLDFTARPLTLIFYMSDVNINIQTDMSSSYMFTVWYYLKMEIELTFIFIY